MRRDLACAALGLAFAGAYWAAARGLPRSMLSDAVGADGVPRGLALLLALFSILIAMRALLRRSQPSVKPRKNCGPRESITVRAHSLSVQTVERSRLAKWKGSRS